MTFKDRRHAGEELAERLMDYAGQAIALAIPRGGVVVGRVVADRLAIPLDVIVPRKLGAPGEPELAIGAVSEQAVLVDQRAVVMLGVIPRYIEQEVVRQRAEIERRMRAYRGDRPAPELSGRKVLLIDDGMATGYTMRAAALGVRAQSPGELILAVPVASREAIDLLSPEVDRVVCLYVPDSFYAVSAFYERFEQTTDEEVVELLSERREARGERRKMRGDSPR